MIRNAVGTLISRIAVAATTNRTRKMLAARKSRIAGPKTTSSAVTATSRTSRTGTIVKISFPGRVSRDQVLLSAVTLLVHPAHDRVEGGHDGHRVRDQVARHHHAHRLEVDERRVVDPHPERLVRAVADHVGGVLAARALDPGVGPAWPRPEQPRQLRHNRPVGHLVNALVDDPEALLDLVDPEQVAGEAVALVTGRDVEVELREDAVRMRPADVERDAGRPQV